MDRLRMLFVIGLAVTFLGSADCVSAESNLGRILEQIQPAVVTIYACVENRMVQGAGFFINKEGDLITNYHVVKGAEAIIARTSTGKLLEIRKIIAKDEKYDLARLGVKLGGNRVRWLEISDRLPAVGEDILVVGNPQKPENTVSNGIISAIRDIENGKILQITAPIADGASGSPVIDKWGKVVGIADAVFQKSQNSNFAIPASKVLALKDTEGVLYVYATPENATIDILNSKSAFSQGMALEPGEYLLKVSGDGFAAAKSWINLDAGEKKEINVNLVKKELAENEILEAQRKESEAEKEQLGAEKNAYEIKKQKLESEKQQVRLKIEKLRAALKKQAAELEPQENHFKADVAESQPKGRQRIPPQTRETENINSFNAHKYNLRRTLNPEAGAWVKKSETCLKKGQWAEAVRTSSIAISLDPGLAGPYIDRAWAYCEKGLFDKAIEDGNIAVYLDPANPIAYVNRAWAFAEQGRYVDALRDCDKALEIDPENYRALNNKGYTFQKSGNIELAKQNYEAACNLDFDTACENYKSLTGYLPSDISAAVKDLLEKSYAAFQQKDWAGVVRTTSKVLELSSDNVQALANRAAAYAYSGKIEAALEDCNSAIRINPDFGLAYNNRGYCYELLGQTKDAALEYEISCGLGEKTGCENYKRMTSQ